MPDEHKPYCFQHEPQQVVYPNRQNEKECVLKFRSKHKQHPLPFYLVCDFELFLTPLEREEEEERNSMKKLDVHNVSGFCCYRISSEQKYCTPPKVYSGPDPMTEFYDHVMEESKVISKIVSRQVPMRPMTSNEHKLHAVATPASELTYIVSSGTLNSTHSLTPGSHRVCKLWRPL